MINKWCKRISNHICTNQNEREIIQYGLNQFFWILLNSFAIAILVRKINEISLDSMLMIYLCFVCVIVLFSPVDNPIHPLSKSDSRIYAKKSRQLVLGYSFLLAISIALRIIILRDSIIYTVLIVGISALAGKWKYRQSHGLAV